MEPSPSDWSARVDRWRDVTTFLLVLAGALALPLVFRRDPFDMFRLPKALLLRTEAILLISVTLGSYVLGAPRPRPKWREPWLLIPLIVMAVFVVLTITSTNRQVSAGVLVSGVATLVVFLATVSVAGRRGWILVVVPLVGAVINGLLVIAEESNLWMPFGEQPGVRHHIQCDALIGNPNEVGGYLGLAALIWLAFVVTRSAGQRWTAPNIAAGLVLGSGLIASQTLTAMAAFAAGALLVLGLSSWTNALRAVLVALVTALLLVNLVSPLRQRTANVISWVNRGEYNALFTERFTAFVAAWSMFVDHPLTGVGPGAFGWQYYDYKLRAEQRYPSLRQAYNRAVNFGEVHNDHLQALAEGGVLGYAAFATLIGALGWISMTIPAGPADSRRRFVRQLALPLALYWIVLSLAQFPMETTVVRSLLIHFAGLFVAWRHA